MTRLGATIALVAMLACCSAPRVVPEAKAPPAPPAPPVAPVTAQPPPVPTNWEDWPVTPGSWTYRADSGGGAGLFAVPGEGARVVMRCDRASGQIIISRMAATTHPGARMTIRTSYGATAWPVEMVAGGLPQVDARIPVADTGLDAIAYSRGRFTVEIPGVAPLVLPSWAEVGRAVEDCR